VEGGKKERKKERKKKKEEQEEEKKNVCLNLFKIYLSIIILFFQTSNFTHPRIRILTISYYVITSTIKSIRTIFFHMIEAS
jgi:hypothetical protein